MHEICPCCQRWQTQPVSAIVEAALNDPSESRADCVAKSYGIRPLSERLALPPKPTLVECFLPNASIFTLEEGELCDKLTLIAPDWARDDHTELVVKWEIARILWGRLMYCADCDSVFDPETRQYEASKDIAILIRT